MLTTHPLNAEVRTAILLPHIPSLCAQGQINFYWNFSVCHSHHTLVYISFICSRISRSTMIHFLSFPVPSVTLRTRLLAEG